MCSAVSEAVDQVLSGAGGLDSEILALVELGDRVDAALVERVGEFDTAEGWAADGAYNFACWLRPRTDVSRSDSSRLGRFARTLRTMPATQAAVEAGTAPSAPPKPWWRWRSEPPQPAPPSPPYTPTSS